MNSEKKFAKKTSKIKSCMLLIFTLIVILIVAGFGLATWYDKQVYQSLSDSTDEVQITVKNGDNLLSIAPNLKSSGLLSSEEVLKVYLRLNNLAPNIKAGSYSIPKNVNIPELINILEKGVFKSAVWVTIPEGFSDAKISDLLKTKFIEAGKEAKFDYDLFNKVVKNPDNYKFKEEVQQFLNKYKPNGKPLTGVLYPDTYRFDVDATSQIVIETLISNLQKRLKDNNIDIENITAKQAEIKNIYEAITLASIIEKEAAFDADRPNVSSVFHNRLKVNYPLESDITIHYITGNEDGFVSLQDLKIDSPYNTYKYAGLTPTPINNPGISSIKAAVEPANTKYFYFLYDTSRKVYYAVTFAEHQENVRKYLK